MAKQIGKIGKVNLDPTKFYEKMRDVAKREMKLDKRESNISEDFQRRTKALIIRELRNNDIFQSLKGDGSLDLPAHFGITDAQGKEAANDIIKNIATVFSITFVPNKSSKTNTMGQYFITEQGLRENLNKLANKEEYRYKGARRINKKRSMTYVIRWMEWLLHPSNNLGINIKDYGIVMGDFKGYEPSRSGRAIMVHKNLGMGATFPYRLPREIFPRRPGSENFVEDLLYSKEFASEMKAILRLAVERIIYRHNTKKYKK